MTLTGVCLCHGVVVTGTPAVSQPTPRAVHDLFGPAKVCWLLVTEHGGAHDVPEAEARQVKS